jgi:hypothetical protein
VVGVYNGEVFQNPGGPGNESGPDRLGLKKDG